MAAFPSTLPLPVWNRVLNECEDCRRIWEQWLELCSQHTSLEQWVS